MNGAAFDFIKLMPWRAKGSSARGVRRAYAARRSATDIFSIAPKRILPVASPGVRPPSPSRRPKKPLRNSLIY